MANAKEIYSEVSKHYCEVEVPACIIAKSDYENSKERERKHNDKWIQEKVNVIDVVNHYASNAKAYEDGVKFVFEGAENKVICDMASGYLRIQNKASNKHYRLDGTLTNSKKRTHFKIKRLEEM
ncbi:MAG: hypothetical protein IK012_11365 [Fibrobacter sp.]|uniref:hypothetical protein n=1 Tax=Fibrobacter sp. TaxID=35828 RepID=UPI0025C2BE6B|nr:hypothetical protein [Fibrobacter sp.]MBR4785830.1 hypothetical protein [Fibrobacter sp.]